jgi:hypothetical protein
VATAYDPTEGVRRRNLIWLGVVILIGFLMPVLEVHGWRRVEVRVNFMNFEVLGEERAPALAKIMCLYPGIAGVAVILLASLARGPGRSGALIGLGALPIIILLASEEARRSLAEIPAEAGGVIVLALLGVLAFIGLFAGSRARSYRPASQAAAVIGIVGGITYLVTLVVPALPPEAGSIQLIALFKLFESKFAVIMALGALAQMGCLIAASIICIVNVRPRHDSESLAGSAFTLLVTGSIVAGSAYFLNTLIVMFQAGREVPAEALAAMLLAVVKFGCWILGLFLLLPMGVTDLVVNLTPAGPAAPPSAGYGPASLPRPGGVYEDPEARFGRLKQLLDDGLITPEEYERKKADLLGRL